MKDIIAYLISERNFKHDSLVVGLTGHIGVGKTHIMKQLCGYLQDEGYVVCIDSLASPLKKLIQAIAYATKNDLELQLVDFVFYGSEDKLLHDLIVANWSTLKVIVDKCDGNWRCLAQEIGSFFRQQYGYDFWVELLKERIVKLKEKCIVDFFIVPDVRYVNEYQILKRNFNDTFLMIRVDRPIENILKSLDITESEYEKQLKHESEIEIDSIPYDFKVINDG